MSAMPDDAEGREIAPADAMVIDRTIEERLAALSIFDPGGGKYFRKDNPVVRVGPVHTIFTGMKATCALHKKCNCYLNIPAHGHRSLVELDLVTWLDDAITAGSSPEEHEAASLALRRDKYGMKVRAKAK